MASPRYQPYLDVPPSPFRWRLGLRPLDPADWLQRDAEHDAELTRKREVLRDHHATAFRALDGVEAEGYEVLQAILDHLGSDGGPVDADLHPLDAAGRMVQEDLVLLVERDGRLVCGGGSVCFPNRWDLASKVGRTMTEIHAPVPRLNDELAAPIDGLLARLTPARSYWRLGWGLMDTDDLYQAVDGTAAPRPAVTAPEGHHLRVERETLRRFPATNCILFTIRTYLCPLDAVKTDADRLGLAAAIAALPSDVGRYKQLDDIDRALVSWLAGPTAHDDAPTPARG